MFQRFYEPHPALKPFVNNIMIHALTNADNSLHFSIPPLPEHCLMFYVRDQVLVENAANKQKGSVSSVIVIGPNLHRHFVTPGCNHVMIKVGFQPGGLYRLLGMPMNELLCQDQFDGLDMLGREMKEVDEKLQEALSYTTMKVIIEKFLLGRVHKLKQPLPIDRVLPLIIKQRGLIKIDQLASDACLSVRQFERVFQQRIGLPPKHFSRLVRFSHAWIMKEHEPNVTWLKIAHECGYFDQMHLIRDFHEFAGVNPSEIESSIAMSQIKFFNRIFV